jgi:hypothetical protein
MKRIWLDKTQVQKMGKVMKDGRTIDPVEKLRSEDLFSIESTIFRFKLKVDLTRLLSTL